MSFVHLHNHMEGSFSDSPMRMEAALDAVAEMGMPAFACTDHGELAAIRPFARAAAKRGIKPIVGMEAYFVPDAAHNIRNRINHRYHLLLLAADAKGWANLRLIASRSWNENCLMQKLGLVDWPLLAAHHEGLICLTGCLAGPAGFPFLDDDGAVAEAHLARLREIFGDRLYCEVFRHGVEEEEKVLRGLLELARRFEIPPVLTNDCHYLKAEDWRIHDALIKTRFGKVSDFALEAHEYYLKTEEEMASLGFPRDYLDRTVEIADRISLTTDEILGPPVPLVLPAAAPKLAVVGDLTPMGLPQAYRDVAAVFQVPRKRREKTARALAQGEEPDDARPEALAVAHAVAEHVRKPGLDFDRVATAEDLPVRVPLRSAEGLAVTMWPAGEVEDAGARILSAEEAADLDPAWARRLEAVRHYRDGAARFRARDLAGAEAAFARAIQADPSFSNARYERGRTRYYAGKVQEALADFEALAEGDPDFERRPHLDSYLGWCYLALGEAARAKEAFAASTAAKPIGGSFVGLAKSHLSLGERDAARALLEKFLDEHPEDRWVEQGKRLLLEIVS